MKINRRMAIAILITSGLFPWLTHYLLFNKKSLANSIKLNTMPDDSVICKKFLELAEEKSKEDPYSDKEKELPPLLYFGLTNRSFYKNIDNYPSYLRAKPDNKQLISIFQADKNFTDYPKRGKKPEINDKGLSFLHEDIKEACICLGSFHNGKLQTKWLGRNALDNGEFWSGTKIIPLVYLLQRSNQEKPLADPYDYVIKGITNQKTEAHLQFSKVAQDIVSYQKDFSKNQEYSSNSLATMLKLLLPQKKLEKWLKDVTGNEKLVFQGKYSKKPFIDQPQLIDSSTGENIFSTDDKQAKFCDCNVLSAYDLTRIISLIGWHHYLPQKAQFEKIQNSSLAILIEALGKDPARLTNLAISELGMQEKLKNVVILSKLGNGSTSYRHRTEAVYVALIQAIDCRTKPARQIMLSMTLKGGLALEGRYKDDLKYDNDSKKLN